jgi:hypothetical protein
MVGLAVKPQAHPGEGFQSAGSLDVHLEDLWGTGAPEVGIAAKAAITRIIRRTNVLWSFITLPLLG